MQDAVLIINSILLTSITAGVWTLVYIIFNGPRKHPEAKEAPAAIGIPAELLIREGAEIVRYSPDGAHVLIGHRELGHPDIQEAIDTVGLAVRWPDGKVDAGYQGGKA